MAIYTIKDSSDFYHKINNTTECMKCWLRHTKVPEPYIEPMQTFYQKWRSNACSKFQALHQAELQQWQQAGYDLTALFQTASNKNFTVYSVMTLTQALDILQSDYKNPYLVDKLCLISGDSVCDAEPAHVNTAAILTPVVINVDFWQRVAAEIDITIYEKLIVEYAIWKQDVMLAEWLQTQNIDVSARVRQMVHTNRFGEGMFDSEFMEGIGLYLGDHQIDMSLGTRFQFKDLLRNYDLQSFNHRQRAKVLTNIMYYSKQEKVKHDLLQAIEIMSPLEWNEMLPYFRGKGLIISEPDVLVLCVEKGFPLQVLKYSLSYCFKGYVQDYLPIFRAVQPILTHEFVKKRLPYLLQQCQDLGLLEIFISEGYLDLEINIEIILDSLCHLLWINSGNGDLSAKAVFQKTIRETIIYYLQTNIDRANCWRVIRHVAKKSEAESEFVIDILERMDMELSIDDVCRMSNLCPELILQLISHKSCRNIDWNHKITLSQAIEFCLEGDDDDPESTPTEFHVTSGLTDVAVLEFVVLVIDKHQVQKLLSELRQMGVQIDWQRFDMYYTYYLDADPDYIRSNYPRDNMLCRFSCSYNHPECFYARLFGTEPYNGLCDAMMQYGVLDARIAQLRNITRSAVENLERDDAFYFSEDECDIPDQNEMCRNFCSTTYNEIGSDTYDDHIIL